MPVCMMYFYMIVVHFLRKHDVFYWKLCHMNPWKHSAVPEVGDSVHRCKIIYMYITFKLVFNRMGTYLTPTHQPEISSETRQPEISSETHQPEMSSETHQPEISRKMHQPELSWKTRNPEVSSEMHHPEISNKTHQPKNQKEIHWPEISKKMFHPGSVSDAQLSGMVRIMNGFTLSMVIVQQQFASMQHLLAIET